MLLDAYFSATKIAWLLDHVPGARAQAERGELAFGTVDSFLLWRLTNGEVHATDATNASRTLLFNIHSGEWDDDLLALFRVPRSMLPEVRDCDAEFGVTAVEHFGMALPIRGVAGDQQAALIGQACFRPGMAKATYGTGGFVLMNTGGNAAASRHRLLTTIAFQWRGERAYALEGSIFSAGATVQWLRDGLGIIANAAETGALAAAADPDQRVYLVPAFSRAGSAALEQRGARRAHRRNARHDAQRDRSRGAGERRLSDARPDRSHARRRRRRPSAPVIRVDGGMSASDWTMQFLADMLDAPIDRPAGIETTALGAAFLAGWRAGLYPGPDEFARSWRLQRRFAASMAASERESRYRGWREAVGRILPAPRV